MARLYGFPLIRDRMRCRGKPERQTNRPKLVSVKRSERGERSEDLLFERSEFQIFSEPKERSSEAGSALNFWLLFFQEKSNKNHLTLTGTAGAAPIFTK